VAEMLRTLLLFLAPLVAVGCFKKLPDAGDGADEGGSEASSVATGSDTSGDEQGAATGMTTGATEASSGEVGASEATGGSADGETAGVERATCENYCAFVEGHCEDDLVQYAAVPTCRAVCETFELGMPGQMFGPNLECRSYHVQLALEDPITHCPHAGPAGRGACGDPCQNFCAIAAQLCPASYDSPESCLSACAMFSPDPPYNANVLSGDSYSCRLAHLMLAATQEVPHCTHIVPMSDVCK